jgi:FKBP-type peptidyl-prolyl cis-trans isomerase SlyD
VQIADGSVATFHYTLKNDAGEVLDTSAGKDPMGYLHGAGNIVPGLERRMVGAKAGDKFEVRIDPIDAYGERSQELQEVPRDAFPKGLDVKKGMMFQAQTQDGDVVPLWIHSVTSEIVMVDPNHPLAGVALNFSVEVVEVRAASQEELAHGHVHGPHGHDHGHDHDGHDHHGHDHDGHDHDH